MGADILCDGVHQPTIIEPLHPIYLDHYQELEPHIQSLYSKYASEEFSKEIIYRLVLSNCPLERLEDKPNPVCEQFAIVQQENPQLVNLVSGAHFDAAIFSMKKKWKQFEWNVLSVQVRFKYHPGRLQREGYFEAFDKDEEL